MDEAILFGVLLLTLAMFAAGRIRYDIVALVALVILTVVGIVPPSEAFLGFSHPAVITVAAVLVLSEVFRSSGIVDVLGRWFSRAGRALTAQITSLSTLVASLSAFMNNVGALSILLPLAIRMARGANRPYSPYLMPLAFASLLGGMTTLVGTPPNIIIASFRKAATGDAFTMFDFTPVGLGVALAGVLFIALIGWRLIPTRQAQPSPGETIEIADYMTEVRVTEGSRYVGRLVRDLEELARDDVAIVGLIHRSRRYGAPSSYQIIDTGDVFIIEANPEDLRSFVDETGFRLDGFSNIRSDVDKAVASDDVTLLEAVVVPNGQIEGRNAAGLHLHSEYGVNLLAVSRSGARIASRLSRVVLQAGDVLLLQGRTELMLAALPRLNLLPLADRDLRIGRPRRLVIPVAVFVGALLLTIFGLLPIHVSLVAAVTLLLLSRFITLQSAYQSINWPIIVLLGAMIPVGGALESTGGAARIAMLVTDLGHTLPPWTILAIVLVTTMLLSDVVNNSTAVILMAPVAMGVAETMGASLDPFLMAVAIGGSSAFLTPIGHQSNTIVMGPGGYKFGDYWRMGLPLDVIIVSVSVPLIMWVWPLTI
jgi:di/tricarboxylate transporter